MAFSEFEALPALADLDVSRVQPAEETELWELRESRWGEEHEVVLVGGTAGRDGVDPGVLADFDALVPSWGFGILCLPGDCFYYVASLRGAALETWETAARLRSFLGPIDSREEAMLLAVAEGYHWRGGKETGAIRERTGGWDLVALRMVNSCDPVRTDQFLLRVTADGRVTVLDSQIWQSTDGVCI